MHKPIIAGHPDAAMFSLLSEGAYAVPVLVNADPVPDSATIIGRCEEFAAGTTGAAIVTLLPNAPPGLANFATHREAAILWAFTRQAALDWAARKIRVNAIGLGSAPFGPFEPDDQAGRGAAEIRATTATADDIARTLRAIAGLPSMTGQLIRLGG
jgi:NAD(P)-dependent dehydrogenase (short-subunit alcohol dehydrogenase family)